MMIKYVIMNDEGVFQYPRNTLEYDKYSCRSFYGPDIEKARIFNNKSSATNSLNYKNGHGTYRSRNGQKPPEGLKVRKIKVSYELVEE